MDSRSLISMLAYMSWSATDALMLVTVIVVNSYIIHQTIDHHVLQRRQENGDANQSSVKYKCHHVTSFCAAADAVA